MCCIVTLTFNEEMKTSVVREDTNELVDMYDDDMESDSDDLSPGEQALLNAAQFGTDPSTSYGEAKPTHVKKPESQKAVESEDPEDQLSDDDNALLNAANKPKGHMSPSPVAEKQQKKQVIVAKKKVTVAVEDKEVKAIKKAEEEDSDSDDLTPDMEALLKAADNNSMRKPEAKPEAEPEAKKPVGKKVAPAELPSVAAPVEVKGEEADGVKEHEEDEGDDDLTPEEQKLLNSAGAVTTPTSKKAAPKKEKAAPKKEALHESIKEAMGKNPNPLVIQGPTAEQIETSTPQSMEARLEAIAHAPATEVEVHVATAAKAEKKAPNADDDEEDMGRSMEKITKNAAKQALAEAMSQPEAKTPQPSEQMQTSPKTSTKISTAKISVPAPETEPIHAMDARSIVLGTASAPVTKAGASPTDSISQLKEELTHAQGLRDSSRKEDGTTASKNKVVYTGMAVPEMNTDSWDSLLAKADKRAVQMAGGAAVPMSLAEHQSAAAMQMKLRAQVAKGFNFEEAEHQPLPRPPSMFAAQAQAEVMMSY